MSPLRTPIRGGLFPLNGLPDKIMKTILSLVLPAKSTWRYITKGRKGIGFKDGTLVTRDATGVEVGIADLAVGDVGTTITTDAQALVSRLNYLTVNAITATLPLVAGSLRDVTVIKNGAGTCVVSRSGSDSGNIVISGAGAGTSATILTGGQARFLSNGTNWYRVSA